MLPTSANSSSSVNDCGASVYNCEADLEFIQTSKCIYTKWHFYMGDFPLFPSNWGNHVRRVNFCAYLILLLMPHGEETTEADTEMGVFKQMLKSTEERRFVYTLINKIKSELNFPAKHSLMKWFKIALKQFVIARIFYLLKQEKTNVSTEISDTRERMRSPTNRPTGCCNDLREAAGD